MNQKNLYQERKIDFNCNYLKHENIIGNEILSLFNSNIPRRTNQVILNNCPFHQSIDRLETVIFIKEF